MAFAPYKMNPNPRRCRTYKTKLPNRNPARSGNEKAKPFSPRCRIYNSNPIRIDVTAVTEAACFGAVPPPNRTPSGWFEADLQNEPTDSRHSRLTKRTQSPAMPDLQNELSPVGKRKSEANFASMPHLQFEPNSDLRHGSDRGRDVPRSQ